MKLIALALLITASPALADSAITLPPSNTLMWETTPEDVAFVPLSGERHSEAYFAMVRLPACATGPQHVKSAAMFGVMIEGQMTLMETGTQIPAAIGSGSCYYVPAGLPHNSDCVSDGPFITMLCQDGAFDLVPVQP